MKDFRVNVEHELREEIDMALSNVVFDYNEFYYCHDHESIGAAPQAILSSISFLYYCLFLKFYTSVKSRRNGILANSKW